MHYFKNNFSQHCLLDNKVIQNFSERMPSFLGKRSILVRECKLLGGTQHFLARKRKVSPENNTFVREQSFSGECSTFGESKTFAGEHQISVKNSIIILEQHYLGECNTFGRT